MCYILNKLLVVVILFQITLLAQCASVEKPPLISPSPSNQTSTNNATISNKTNNQVHEKVPVPMEGGGGLSTEIKLAQNNTSSTHPYGREHEISKPVISGNHSSVKNGTTPKEKPISPVSSSTSTSSTERSIPISEKPSLPNSEHKKITPRKGVNFTEFINSQKTANATTVKPRPKKPTLTVPSADEPYAPSHFQSNSRISNSNSTVAQVIPHVPLDLLPENNQGKTQQYVLPIVIVILSVPFVAILISILYKRGSEWWKYRHYRRMDFLINEW